MNWSRNEDHIEECFNCGGREFDASSRWTFGDIQLVACRGCNLLHLWPILMHEEGVESLNDGETGRQIDLMEDGDVVAFNHGNGILDLVESFKSGGRILDVGCKFGGLLKAARDRGWDPVGLDVNPAFCEFVSRNGFEIHSTYLENMPESVEPFDVITMSHVLEHIERPDSALKAIRERLNPGGLVYIETPDVSSPIAWAVYRGRWLGVTTPGHVWAYTQRTLTDVISNQGLEVIWSGRWIPYAPTDYPKTLKGQIRRCLFGAINRFGYGDIVGVLARAA
ncbi:MAG: class I SAM-dependent methyltransferase [Candidatus Latescibacteria bacterium]|nr:class I SAM-dependent methyltransferase [Candidatus Latescibacterota bacterium]